MDLRYNSLRCVFAVVISSTTGSILLGTLASIIVSIILSSLIFAVRFLRANLFVVGIAVNLLSVGLTVVLTDVWFSSKGTIVFGGSPGLPLFLSDVLGGTVFGWLNGLGFLI